MPGEGTSCLGWCSRARTIYQEPRSLQFASYFGDLRQPQEGRGPKRCAGPGEGVQQDPREGPGSSPLSPISKVDGQAGIGGVPANGDHSGSHHRRFRAIRPSLTKYTFLLTDARACTLTGGNTMFSKNMYQGLRRGCRPPAKAEAFARARKRGPTIHEYKALRRKGDLSGDIRGIRIIITGVSSRTPTTARQET